MSEEKKQPPTPDMIVELRFLEKTAERRPDDKRILKALGDLYTACGRYEEGLNVDLKLVRLVPDESEAWYNLGCSHALLLKKSEAYQALEKALSLGYSDAEWMSKDRDLASLREDPEFAVLLKRVSKERA